MNTIRPSRFALWLAVLLLMPLWVQASSVVRASTTNNAWQRAEPLGLDPNAAVMYGRLNGTGDARYYSFRASRPTQLSIQVEVAEEAARLEPRVVLYSPEMLTIGPALPMPQPPKTLALVYPANAAEIHVEGPLRTTMATRVDQTVGVDRAGDYYLAVYNAGKQSGAYRLTVTGRGYDQWPMSARIRSWWLANVWLGPQYGALTIPLLVALAAVAAWLIIRHIPHPLPARAPRRRTKRTIIRGRLS